jgi:hypothetical protein
MIPCEWGNHSNYSSLAKGFNFFFCLLVTNFAAFARFMTTAGRGSRRGGL